ncbi:dienelactone hydrolase family protein [Nocardia sp. NPDC058666]|uniref:dienelactone hydrolase family protein n=1 Tax=Nocardia sp. NPDC058666 TaxID=3346587 RepID=UPI003647EF7B
MASDSARAWNDTVIRSEADTAAVVLVHEVFGLTDSMVDLAQRLCEATEATIYVPHLLDTDPFDRADQTIAYERFMTTLGPAALAARVLDYTAARLAKHYDAVYCVGVSVGATAAWIASASEQFDAVLPVYGSRIRDHLDIRPAGRAHLVFAEHEPSFDPHELAPSLAAIDRVSVEVVPFGHGFCSADSPTYAEAGLRTVLAAARTLTRGHVDAARLQL